MLRPLHILHSHIQDRLDNLDIRQWCRERPEPRDTHRSVVEPPDIHRRPEEWLHPARLDILPLMVKDIHQLDTTKSNR